MVTMSKILIPVDFTENTKNTVEVGLNWARNFNLKPVMLYASEAFAINDGPEFTEILSQVHKHPLKDKIKIVAEDKLAKIKRELNYEEDVEIHCLFGSPEEVITRFTKENDVAIVVMGHHDKTLSEQVFIGSVTEKVMRNVECPVLSVQGNEPVNPQRIMGLIDLSDTSDKVFVRIKNTAKKFGASVHLVHQVEPHSDIVQRLHDSADFSTYDDLLEAGLAKAKEEMAKFEEEIQEAGLEVTSTVNASRDYKTHDNLIKETEKSNADLVILGTHGYSGLKKFLFGSTAELYLRRSPKSLLIAR